MTMASKSNSSRTTESRAELNAISCCCEAIHQKPREAQTQLATEVQFVESLIVDPEADLDVMALIPSYATNYKVAKSKKGPISTEWRFQRVCKVWCAGYRQYKNLYI